MEMNVANQIVYGSCWAILIMYMLTSVLVFTQRSCTSFAASFLFACALWVDLTVFNFCVLMPAFFRHLCELELVPAVAGNGGFADAASSMVRSLATSPALEDLALMLVGWLASAMSISNSFDLWQRMERRLDTGPHFHGPLATRIIWLAGRVDGRVGIEQAEELRLPDVHGNGSCRTRPSAIFAVPRWGHKYMAMLLSQDPLQKCGHIALRETEKIFHL